jgi:hypothetical protein
MKSDIDNWLVVYLPLWKMMEFVNGKDDNPYMKWEIKNVPNHQPVYIYTHTYVYTYIYLYIYISVLSTPLTNSLTSGIIPVFVDPSLWCPFGKSRGPHMT